MSHRTVIAVLCAFVLPSGVAGQRPNVLSAAEAVLGTNGLRSVTFTAVGQAYVFGQQPTATEPWPVVSVKSYRIAIDYVTGAMRVEQVLAMPQPRGGAPVMAGEQRQVLYSRDAFAWNETAGQGDASTMTPQPAASADRVIWTWAAAPQGLIKAADATAVRTTRTGAEFSATVGGRYRLTATIDKANHVDSARTWVPDDVLGDTLVEVAYSGYRNFGPIVFPSRIVMRQGGHPSLDLTITGVATNDVVDVTVPDNVRAAVVAAPSTQSVRVADGIYWITGGTYHSMAVDMGDHVVVVEAPQNEARSNAVIAEVKRLLPGKPIRYVVNTHVHFDHSGGLRAYVDEGAIVVTHRANLTFYDKVWRVPRTIVGDRLSKSGRKWTFQGVADRSVLRGTTDRTIELHVLPGSPHCEHMLVAWLPADDVMFQSDLLGAPPPSPTTINFYQTLQQLKIQPGKIVGGHGTRIATMANVQAIVTAAATK